MKADPTRLTPRRSEAIDGERPQSPRHPVNAMLNYAYAVLESAKILYEYPF